jgi:hypothetical protein
MDEGLSPQPRKRRRTRGRLCALGLLAIALLASTGSTARACPVADLDCVVDKTEDIVGDAQDKVEDVTGTVEDTVKDATSEVDETVDKVIGDTTDDVGETISDTVGSPGVRQPGLETYVSSGSGLGEGSRDRVRGSRSKPDSRTKSAAAKRASARTRIGGPRRSAAISDPGVTALRAGSAHPVARADSPAEGDFPHVAKEFAFPLVLSTLVGLFLFLQSRVDRRDPKLALAPLDTEIVLFR